MSGEQQTKGVFINKDELALKGLDLSLKFTTESQVFNKLDGSKKRCFLNNYDKTLAEIIDGKK